MAAIPALITGSSCEPTWNIDRIGPRLAEDRHTTGR